jgi:hypothetical protein
MATIAEPQPQRSGASEERFFLTMALVMAAILVAGFATNIVVGRSTFASPLLVHIHAFVFFGWVTLYVTQNVLVASGNVAIHRRLGWLAVLWVPAMVVMGILITVHSLQSRGGPPFFAMNEFMITNPMGVLYFAAMVFTAIRFRRQTDWHRRFMYSGMAALVGPGIGRLLPMPFLIPVAWWVASVLPPLILIGIAARADKSRTGKVHRAWLWTASLLVASQLVAEAIAWSPIGYAITHAVVDGTPGGARQFPAFFPT